MDARYNAAIISDTIEVNDIFNNIEADSHNQYESFLFDNQGTEVIEISINNKSIKLEVNAILNIVQANVISIKIKCNTGKTSKLFYHFQGYKRTPFTGGEE